MNSNDILTLAKAGFTATQISALIQMQTAQPVQQAQPIQQVQPVQPVQQVQQVQPLQQVQADPIMAQLEKLTGALQANALLQTNMPQQQQSTDDILATIINPPVKGE